MRQQGRAELSPTAGHSIRAGARLHRAGHESAPAWSSSRSDGATVFSDQNPSVKSEPRSGHAVAGNRRRHARHEASQLDRNADPSLRLPASNTYGNFAQLLIRTKGEATALVPADGRKSRRLTRRRPSRESPHLRRNGGIRCAVADGDDVDESFGAMARCWRPSAFRCGAYASAAARARSACGWLAAATGDVLKIVLAKGY